MGSAPQSPQEEQEEEKREKVCGESLGSFPAVGPFDSVAMVIITAHKDHPSLWQAACFWLLVHSYSAQASVGHTGERRDRL